VIKLITQVPGDDQDLEPGLGQRRPARRVTDMRTNAARPAIAHTLNPYGILALLQPGPSHMRTSARISACRQAGYSATGSGSGNAGAGSASMIGPRDAARAFILSMNCCLNASASIVCW
jgi:hypothetical protein